MRAMTCLTISSIVSSETAEDPTVDAATRRPCSAENSDGKCLRERRNCWQDRAGAAAGVERCGTALPARAAATAIGCLEYGSRRWRRNGRGASGGRSAAAGDNRCDAPDVAPTSPALHGTSRRRLRCRRRRHCREAADRGIGRRRWTGGGSTRGGSTGAGVAAGSVADRPVRSGSHPGRSSVDNPAAPRRGHWRPDAADGWRLESVGSRRAARAAPSALRLRLQRSRTPRPDDRNTPRAMPRSRRSRSRCCRLRT